MPVHLLDEQKTARLRAAPLSFTRHEGSEGDAPAGYNRLNRSVTLRRRDFDAAARDLFGWRMHSRAGLRVQASDIPLCQDTVVLMRWGLGPLSVKIPCRVLDIIDESRHRGFAYGTVPGHPEAGEERFVLEQLEDGRIHHHRLLSTGVETGQVRRFDQPGRTKPHPPAIPRRLG